MDTTPPSSSSPHLEWSNVGFGFTFIAMNVVLSQALQLKIGTSLVISAVRCTVQLAFVATILQRVFSAHNIWTVAAIARTSSHPSTSIPVAHGQRRQCY
jgi:ABC-type iron transport system FetAB permease component